MAQITRNISELTTTKIADYIANAMLDKFGLSVDINDLGKSICFTVLSPTGVELGTTEFYDFDEFPIGRGFGARTGIFLEGEAGGSFVKNLRAALDNEFPRNRKG